MMSTVPCSENPSSAVDFFRLDAANSIEAERRRDCFTRVTDITLSPSSTSFALIIAPIIRGLIQNDEGRWITWIGAGKPSPGIMRQHGLNTYRFRVINTLTDADGLWTTWEALSQGNSQLVISQFSTAQSEHLAHLQHAAELGQCHSLLLTCYDAQRLSA